MPRRWSSLKDGTWKLVSGFVVTSIAGEKRGTGRPRLLSLG